MKKGNARKQAVVILNIGSSQSASMWSGHSIEKHIREGYIPAGGPYKEIDGSLSLIMYRQELVGVPYPPWKESWLSIQKRRFRKWLHGTRLYRIYATRFLYCGVDDAIDVKSSPRF